MPGTIYFIRNEDIYKIGVTNDLVRRMKELRPDEIIATQVTAYYKDYEKELHSKYRHCRIPQTEYFRLTPDEVNEVLYRLTDDGKPHWVNEAEQESSDKWALSFVSLLMTVAFIGVSSMIHTVWTDAWTSNFFVELLEGILSLLLIVWTIGSLLSAVWSSIKQGVVFAWWKKKEAGGSQ